MLDVFGRAYGGQWTGSALSLTNGSVVATRIADTLGDSAAAGGFLVSSLTASEGSTDQTWIGSRFSVRSLARFSGYEQEFGYWLSGAFVPLFRESGDEFSVSGRADSVDLTGSTFHWARRGDSGIHSSFAAYNADSRDHLVTYQVDGLDAGPRWLLFWEDLDRTPTLGRKRSSSDFNDLVVEVSAAATSGAVPLPAGLIPGLILVVAIAAVASLCKKAKAH